MHIVHIEKSNILPFLKYNYLHSFLLQMEDKQVAPRCASLFAIAGAGDMHVRASVGSLAGLASLTTRLL